MPIFPSGAAIDRPEIIHLIHPPIPEVVWQQPQESHLTNTHKALTTDIHKNTHMPQFKRKNDVELQTSPMKKTSPQVSGSSTEPFLGNQPGSTPVQSLNDPKKRPSEIQRREITLTANGIGDDNISPPKITNSQIEE